jgi:hypothetical protein
VEPPKLLLLEGMIDVSWLDGVYTSPIQHWIEESCSDACHPWHDLGVLSQFQEYTSFSSQSTTRFKRLIS